MLQKQAGFPFLNEPESLEADRCGASHASGWRGGRGLPVAVRAVGLYVYCLCVCTICASIDTCKLGPDILFKAIRASLLTTLCGYGADNVRALLGSVV